MADLDDFFAKKDRKKSKGKKFTTTEEIAKKLEETGKKIEKPKPKEKPINPEGGEDNQQPEEEDEWKDFEEEKKDYTGLKIGNLTVSEMISTESEDDRGTGENSSDGELGDNMSKSGPWKKTDKPPEVEKPPAEIVEQQNSQSQKDTSGSTTKSTYKPPAFRRPQAQQAPMSRLRNKNIAPDISSEEYFPTLSSKQASSAAESTGPWGRRKKDEGSFEEVRNRGPTRPAESQNQGPKLSLGNKYGALPQDQS